MTRLLTFLLIFMAVCAILSACGGGGGTASDSAPALPAKILDWTPPGTFSDSTPLNPASDLQVYEIYINQTGVFSNADVPAAYVGAVDSSTGALITSFNLSNLGSFLSKGITYRVSIRAVAVTGTKSDFAAPATFSF